LEGWDCGARFLKDHWQFDWFFRDSHFSHWIWLVAKILTKFSQIFSLFLRLQYFSWKFVIIIWENVSRGGHNFWDYWTIDFWNSCRFLGILVIYLELFLEFLENLHKIPLEFLEFWWNSGIIWDYWTMRNFNYFPFDVSNEYTFLNWEYCKNIF
jgi:hypothetical protein